MDGPTSRNGEKGIVMKKVMLVSILDGEQFARFYDDVEKAIADADALMVGLGGYAEVYERQDPSEENEYDSSYICVYWG